MSQDLPQPLQDLYDHVLFVLNAHLPDEERQETQQALAALVEPYRAAQSRVAGTQGPYRFITAWDLRPARDHPGTARIGDRIIDNPPTLLDLVLKAQEQEDAV